MKSSTYISHFWTDALKNRLSWLNWIYEVIELVDGLQQAEQTSVAKQNSEGRQ